MGLAAGNHTLQHPLAQKFVSVIVLVSPFPPQHRADTKRGPRPTPHPEAWSAGFGDSCLS